MMAPIGVEVFFSGCLEETLLNTLRKFQQLTRRHRLLCLQVFFLNLSVWLRLNVFPLASTLEDMGFLTDRQSNPSAKAHSDKQVLESKELAILVAQVCNHTPWPSKCMDRSITICLMLRKLGFFPEMKIGAQKAEEILETHAWVTIDGQVVSLEHDLSPFVELHRYSMRG